MKDIRDGFFLELLKKYKSNKSIYFLSIDQGFLLREDFKKISKDRFIDVSISEQNSILIAAGLALNNKKVFIFGINSFLIKRCFEQIYLYMFNMNLDINLICSGPGYSYSGDGVSHFSLDDLGLLKNYKNIKIYHPSNYETSKFSSLEMISIKNPTVIRLDKGEYEFIRHDKKKSLKNGFIIQKKVQSSKTLIISYGVTSTYIKDLNHNIINVFRINPISKKLINLINFFKRVIIVEEAYEYSGLYSIFMSKYKNYINVQLEQIAVPNSFLNHYGSRDYLNKKFLKLSRL